MRNSDILLGIGIIGAGAAIWLMTRKSSTRTILNELFPTGFTATSSQLDILVAEGYPIGSKVYEEAIDIAFNDVSKVCAGSGLYISWSSTLGYYCTPE